MNIKGILLGTLYAYIISFVFLLIGASLIYFNLLSEQAVTIGVFFGMALGIFIGSYGAAKTCESKVLLNALSVSFLFSLIFFSAAIILNNGIPAQSRIPAIICGSFAAGFIGAVAGK